MELKSKPWTRPAEPNIITNYDRPLPSHLPAGAFSPGPPFPICRFFTLLCRTGGMPQMVFEYILKKHNIDPKADLNIDQSIDFGSTAAAFSGGQADFTVV